jgi:predicted nucleic acid-binding protein
MRILLDTNVVLDIALDRIPFSVAASRILEASDFDRVHLFITGSIATDIYYVLRKEEGRETALAFLGDLMKAVDVCAVDKNVLLQALASMFPDFEDAVQNYAAIETSLDIIVTRNPKDFSTSSLMVVLPEEFVKAHIPAG